MNGQDFPRDPQKPSGTAFSAWQAMAMPLFLCVLFSSACREASPPVKERLRTVKTIVVGAPAGDEWRKFPGTVKAVDTSSLSFEVGGLVQAVRVDIGDKVKKGDVLAVLDKEPFQLKVDSSRAALSRAQATFSEKKSAYEREVRIQTQDTGATSQKAVDQALAAFESTRENVTYRQAQLDLARRDLEKTELRAPFSGVISNRSVEPFEEVQPGKPVLDVFVEGAMEVEVKVPENVIGKVSVGLHGEVRLYIRPDKVYRSVVSYVGSAATSANAFPVKASIRDADRFVQPGMTAELRLVFRRDNGQPAYLIPVEALAPGFGKDGWSVYLFDPDTATVRKTAVEGTGILGNQAVVTKGIEPGDRVVVAGVSFLRDGQKVGLASGQPPAADVSSANP